MPIALIQNILRAGGNNVRVSGQTRRGLDS